MTAKLATWLWGELNATSYVITSRGWHEGAQLSRPEMSGSAIHSA